MDFISKLTSYLPFFGTTNSTSSPKKVFSKFSSSDDIKNAYEKQVNLFISDMLPSYHLTSATLTSSHDRLHFTYRDSLGLEQNYRFENEESFRLWLIEKREADIWEIEDKRDSQPTLTYLLQKPKEWGFESFSSDQALFEQITEESGEHWKLVNHEKTIYFCARMGWSRKYTFEQRNLEDLVHFLKTPLSPLLTIDGRKLKGVLFTCLLGYTGSKLMETFSSIHLPALAFGAFATHSMALKNGVASAHLPLMSLLSGMISSAAAQQIPTLTVPSPLSVQVNPGDSVNLPLASYFSIASNLSLGFLANLPPFMTLNKAPPLINTITGLGPVWDVTIVGNILHAFGNGYRTINMSSTPPQVLGIYGNGTSVYESALHLNYAHLAAGTNGYQIVNATNPRNLTMVAQIPATTNVYTIAIDAARSIAWIGDTTLKSVNIANPANPVVLQTLPFLSGQLITAINVGKNNKLYVFSELYISGSYVPILLNINATNPASFNVIGNNTDVYIPGNSFGMDCIDPICLVGGYFSFYACNMTSAVPSCAQTSYAGYGTPQGWSSKTMTWNQAVYIATDTPGFLIMDIGNKFTPNSPSTGYAFVASNGSTNSVYVLNNVLYASTDNGIYIYQGNGRNNTISIRPTVANRGIHQFTIFVTNFLGDSANLNVSVEVTDQAPTVANALPPLTAILNNYFFYLVPNDTFSDVDDAVNRLSIALYAGGLPFIFNNVTRVIEGTPTQLGDYNISLTATDPFGKSAVARTTVQVQSSNPSSNTVVVTIPTGSSSSSSNVAGAVIGSLFGIAVVAVVVGGVVYFFVLRKKKNTEEFKLSPLVINKKFKSTFGNGKYATLDWTREEIESCYQQTGLLAQPGTGQIGKGHYGDVSACWDITNSAYAVMKVVDDPSKFKASIEEADRQKASAGRGVWPIYHYTQDDVQNRLVLLYPPAGLKDLNFVSQRIQETGMNDKRELIASFIADDMLQGLLTLRKANMSHLDLKGPNILVSKEGQAGISDFGCSFQTKEKLLDNVTSDVNYKSPEQFDQGKIYSDKEDAWATGLTLLSFLLQKSPAVFISVATYRERNRSNPSYTYRQHVEEQLKKIQELSVPLEGSLWHVVKMLTSTDPDTRWTAAEALKAKCFSQLNVSQKSQLFGPLLPQLPNETDLTIPQENTPPIRQYENLGKREYENV